MVATTPGDSPAGTDRARRVAAAAVVILFAAVAIVLVRTVFGTWHATGDQALIELRTFDVGGRHTPLVGPYSRFGWSHPGPALFYALSPVVRVFGGHDSGILAGALAINALALGAICAVAWRRRDAAAWVLIVLVAAILARALNAQALLDPWNPYVIVLPLFAAAVCAWSAASGSRWALVATVLLASFVAQTHIGAAAPAVALAALALLWTAIGTHRASPRERRRRVRSIAFALVAIVVVWIPPVVQAATSSGGNLRAIWNFWTAPHSADGYAQGARFVSPQFAVPAPWMGANEHTSLSGALLPSANRFPVALILLAAVTFAAARRRDRDATALCSLAWAFAIATWVAASSIVETPFPYLLRWAWGAGALAWLAIAWGSWRAIPPRVAKARAPALTAAAISACVLGTFVAVGAARTPFPVSTESHTVAEVRGPVLAALRHAPTPILVDYGSSLTAANLAAGIFLEADRAGLPVRVPPSIGYRVDKSRALHSRPGSVLIVTTDATPDPRVRDGAYRLVAAYDALDPGDRAALNRLLARVGGSLAGLAALQRDHPHDYARLESLKAHDIRVAVFLGTS